MAQAAAGQDRQRAWLPAAGATVAVIAAVKLAVHLYACRYYGYFVDELYYIACSHHLAWGYVDQPPLIAIVVAVVRWTMGDSLPALRLPAALAGVALILMTGLLARELGGGRFAQGLAALCILAAPAFLVMNHLMTMNAFEPLFWTGCALLMARMIDNGDAKLWLWFGLLAGIGLENKHSMLLFGFAGVAGLLLTPQRRLLRSRWLWSGGLLAFLIWAPNLLWNIQHHWPFLELQENIRRSGRNVHLSVGSFFGEEALAMMPLTLPIWVAGLAFFFTRNGKRFRALGWAWLIIAVLIMALNPRVYYLFPAFPILFAAGAVAWERWLERPGLSWARFAYPGVIIVAAIALAPLAIPVLPPETYIRYTQATHLQQPRIETARLGPLPQLFADQFGWQEMTAAVAQVYHRLPPDVQQKTAIFGQNYGQAGAIDFFGPKYGLPHAISGHQSYFLWGPRGYTGESVIVMGDRRESLEPQFEHVEKAGTVYHPYSMPYEHFDVFYCRGMKRPLTEVWPRLKSWD